MSLAGSQTCSPIIPGLIDMSMRFSDKTSPKGLEAKTLGLAPVIYLGCSWEALVSGISYNDFFRIASTVMISPETRVAIFGDVVMDMEDFCVLVDYALTNVDLGLFEEKDDPRQTWVEYIKMIPQSTFPSGDPRPAFLCSVQKAQEGEGWGGMGRRIHLPDWQINA